ncbi:MAG TPA: AcvB/VirJ family lysyl-phosphatidylglycerol hydrolase, partial [Candidatus Polarisedimenticolia bacterium]|nr:AcvB/VirJ family lysyl-phosphatidylglycerol hydrolase [Candidatus Polarisedimenticolia bacterium]
ASFEVSPLDWIRTHEASTSHPVGRALRALSGLPILCLDPSDHEESGCPEQGTATLTRATRSGGHHFGGDFEGLAAHILTFLSEGPEAR